MLLYLPEADMPFLSARVCLVTWLSSENQSVTKHLLLALLGGSFSSNWENLKPDDCKKKTNSWVNEFGLSPYV